jgi:hypothetical protein
VCERKATIAPTLDEAMRIVDGAKSKCWVSYQLRKKENQLDLCVQFKLM